MSPKTDPKKTASPTDKGFSTEEKAAMKAYAQELKLAARISKNREEGEKTLLAAISTMSESDRSIGTRLHEIITAVAPDLMPKTWYGMPAYANKDDKIVLFFQSAGKFNVRYATLGFQPDAKLDDGNMWPTSFALVKLTSTEEEKIRALVLQAVS